MEDFFNQFRENLEHRPEPGFQERHWLRMKAQLEAERQARLPFAWWWLAIPVLLLLGTSNTFFYLKWEAAEEKIGRLMLRQDTVILTHVIHTRDTFYQTRVLWAARPPMRPVNFEIKTAPKPSNQQLLDPGRLAYKVADSTFAADSILAFQKPVLDIALLPARPLADDRTEYFRRPYPIPADALREKTGKQQKRLLQELWQTARPRAYQAGMGGGLTFPFGREVQYSSGYVLGLHGAMEFSPKLRLWGDLSYGQAVFTTTRMGQDIGVPVEVLPSNDYRFVLAEVPQQYWQYAAGIQYVFNGQKRLRPFVGAGFAAVSLLPYDVGYEFKDIITGREWNLDKSVAARGMKGNFIVLPAGLECSFRKHFNWQMLVEYRHNWYHNDAHLPLMFGLQSRLSYRF